MEQQDIYQQLETLKATLAQSVGLDDSSRQRMLDLIDRLEEQVNATGGDDGGLVSQLESHVTEFEVSHPSLSGTIKDIMVMLGNMGV